MVIDDLGSADKFYKKQVSVYPVTSGVLIDFDNYGAALLALDPNDEDIFHVQSNGKITYYFMYNIRTERWSK